MHRLTLQQTGEVFVFAGFVDQGSFVVIGVWIGSRNVSEVFERMYAQS